MITTNILRAGAALLFLVFAGKTGILAFTVFYINAFVFASVNQFFIPAEAASIPDLVKKEELLKANALFTQTLYVTFILGVSLAGPVQQIFGKNAPYPIAAGMFGICALLLMRLPKLKKVSAEVHVSHFLVDLFKEAYDSFQFIKKRLELYVPVLEITIAQVAVGVMVVLAPGFVDKILKIPVSQSGLLVTPAGIGMILGALVAGTFEKIKKRTLVRFGFITLSVLIMSLAYIREIGQFLDIERFDLKIPAAGGIILLLVTLSFLIGIQLALILVPSQTQLSESSSAETRGRVFGFLNMAVNLSATVPLMIAGLLADIFDIKNIIFYFGVLVMVFTAGVFWLTKKHE